MNVDRHWNYSAGFDNLSSAAIELFAKSLKLGLERLELGWLQEVDEQHAPQVIALMLRAYQSNRAPLREVG